MITQEMMTQARRCRYCGSYELFKAKPRQDGFWETRCRICGKLYDYYKIEENGRKENK